MIKRIGRALVCYVLERQVQALRKRHVFTIVTVSGSLGKTSTKHAIAHVLESAGRAVRYQKGNYNDRVTVPLVVFGHDMPGLFDARAWLHIFLANRRSINSGVDFDIVVLELGTDAPGFMKDFSYLKPDLAVITAVAPEHMENFGDLDAVAQEEMAVARYAQHLLIGVDMIDEQYRKDLEASSYSEQGDDATYSAHGVETTINSQSYVVSEQGEKGHEATTKLLGKQGRVTSLAAAAAARELGVEWPAILDGLRTLEPVAGRMQILAGINGSTLIDDTYNAVPASIIAALDVLSELPVGRRIAVVGSMNELGEYTKAAHEEVAHALNARPLDAIVVVGAVAKELLAPLLDTSDGRAVEAYVSAVEAGEALRSLQFDADTAVLFKGSQNGVFTEEALKVVLADPADSAKLVRQSEQWLTAKHQHFAASANKSN